MEEDPCFKQVIPYLIIERDNGILVYQGTKAGDARLHDRMSIGVGGHINDRDNTFYESLMRGVHEEGGIVRYQDRRRSQRQASASRIRTAVGKRILIFPASIFWIVRASRIGRLPLVSGAIRPSFDSHLLPSPQPLGRMPF